MARYGDEQQRYPNTGVDANLEINPDRIFITPDSPSLIDQVTVPQVTANQDNYPLPTREVVLFTTDASRNFTGFSGARPGLTVFANVGTQDGVIVNNSASSTTENRVLCHTAANITLNAGESVIIFYDYASSRWRTVGFI